MLLYTLEVMQFSLVVVQRELLEILAQKFIKVPLLMDGIVH